MFESAFAYSREMQVILFVVSILNAIISYHCVMNLIVEMYGQAINAKQRALFILFSGLFLNQVATYLIYFANGMANFTPEIYAFVTTPNPLYSLLFYNVGFRIIGFSKYRSIHLARLVYFYILLAYLLNQAVTVRFFAQSGSKYNYMLDAASILVCLVINLLLYFFIRLPVKHWHLMIRYTDSLPVKSLPLELTKNLLLYTLAYLGIVGLTIANDLAGYTYIQAFVLLLLVSLLIILLRFKQILQSALQNRAIYLRILTNAMEDFAGLRHDFNNILQTYGGYLSIGELEKLKGYHKSLCSTTKFVEDKLDISRWNAQNPGLTATLLRKEEAAAQKQVHYIINVLCDIRHLFVEGSSLCFAVSEILNAAIESAGQSEARRVSFSIEEKKDASKLIVVTASTQTDALGATQRAKQKDDIVDELFDSFRQHLESHRNVFYHISNYSGELSVYIEIYPKTI